MPNITKHEVKVPAEIPDDQGMSVEIDYEVDGTFGFEIEIREEVVTKDGTIVWDKDISFWNKGDWSDGDLIELDANDLANVNEGDELITRSKIIAGGLITGDTSVESKLTKVTDTDQASGSGKDTDGASDEIAQWANAILGVIAGGIAGAIAYMWSQDTYVAGITLILGVLFATGVGYLLGAINDQWSPVSYLQYEDGNEYDVGTVPAIFSVICGVVGALAVGMYAEEIFGLVTSSKTNSRNKTNSDIRKNTIL